jgi:general secretion pathway protein D
MKHWLFITILLSCLACAAKEKTAQGPSKNDLKLAEKNFQHALQLQKDGQIEEAFQEVSKASTLAPANREYLMVRELLRSRIAGNYIDHGNLLAEIGDTKGAQNQFKDALAIDPENGYAQERLHDVTPEDPEHEHVLQMLASVEEVSAKPKPGRQSFHVHGDSRELYEAIGKAFGITMAYDSSLTTQRVRFDVDNLDFYTAMRLAGKVTRTFWAPIASTRVMVANDNQEMRRQYQRMSLQTFYVGNAATPADLNDVANVLRNVFEVRLVSVVPEKNIISVRAPKEQMDVIAAVLDDAIKGRPEVLLDIKAYELDYDKLRNQGLGLQTSFQIFNVYAAIYAALGPAAQPIINQLQQTGTIDPSKVPIGSLSGLQNSPLLQPFIFFGKGYGLTGVNVSPITARLSSNISSSTDLEHVTLRASNGTPATLTIGTRFPISLGSFTNVSITNQGLPQVGSAFPQVQYEDLGLTFKATPHLQTEENVNLELQLQIKGLGATQLNGVPVITNRNYSGSITVKDGEPSVVAGIIEEQVNRSTSGYPGAGQLPVLSDLLNLNSKEHSRTEILIVITPHIVRKPFRHLETVLWDANQ